MVGIGDDNVTGSGVTGDRGGHDADGTGSGDEDIFAEDGKGERGVDGVAERVEDSGNLMLDAGGVLPDVGHGKNDEFREGSIAINTYAEGVGAEMATTGEAVAAAAADDVAFPTDELADGKIGDVGAEFDDLADKLVADDEALTDGGASPGVPVVDVEVSTADPSVEDADFDVVDTDFGFGNVFKPETAFAAAFYECLHEREPFRLRTLIWTREQLGSCGVTDCEAMVSILNVMEGLPGIWPLV